MYKMQKFFIDINSEIEINKSTLKELCAPFGIKFKIINSNVFILNCVKKRNNITEFSNYANGLVFEKVDGSWDVVCRPLPNLNRTEIPELQEGTYCVQRIYDGMIVNLYYSRFYNKWLFGTSHTNDISEYEWRGVKYCDILANLGINYDSLEKDTTYIYSVSDTRLHLFHNKNEHRLLATFKDQELCFQECEEVTKEHIIETSRITCKDLIKNRTLKNIPCLGYIIRRDNGEDIIVPSKLWTKIEEMLYRPPFIKDIKTRKSVFELYKNIDYITANNYVRNYRYASELIPQMQQRFKQLMIIENQLIKYLQSNKAKKIELFEEYVYPYNINLYNARKYVVSTRYMNIDYYYKLLTNF